ncbi:transcriptional regulator [Streptomyces sp. SID3212]|uniref:helix-turn-helix domain-containing protein n=1 Tax=Streptomyces sp. SID3212 TaxID=2690259 RepID=UPI001370B8B6|nr:helix-turn-helix domain-containing protein [Streptomyces sp. SID3212]
MPEATGAGRADAFAELLLELKERSGLSYGALAKRLHMSTSTLHRYCSGAAVPNEYAPVERLARACRATPQELMELHRRWILADAVRGGRAESQAEAGTEAGTEAAAGLGAGAGAGDGPVSVSGSDPGSGSGAASSSVPASGSVPADPSVPADDRTDSAPPVPDPVVTDAPPDPNPASPARRRRTTLIAAVAVAAVLGAGALAAQGPFGGGKDDTGAGGAAGATSVTTGKAQPPHPSATDSRTPSPSRESGESGGSHKPSAPTSASPPRTTDPGASNDGAGPGAANPADPADAVPLNVATRPYIYDNPCSQHFLVDSEPEQVGPPATEQDAPRWAAAYGAVSSEEQRVALTVQGTGQDTVVLEALHVRVLTKGAPLAWNDYAMGVGCGGGVETKSFDIDLDNGSPTVNVKNGQRDFPYKVSESDPEIFYITAHAAAHDVRWDLSLEWSSGSRRGTVHIDNDGTPFRTSAGAARPGYDYPLGGGEWIKREGG